MNEFGIRAKGATIASLGLKNVSAAYWNLSPSELVEETILLGEGVLTDTSRLTAGIKSLRSKYQEASPYPYLVLDDLFSERLLDRVVDQCQRRATQTGSTMMTIISGNSISALL